MEVLPRMTIHHGVLRRIFSAQPLTQVNRMHQLAHQQDCHQLGEGRNNSMIFFCQCQARPDAQYS